MRIERVIVTTALVFFAIGALCGFFIGKGIYQPTYDVKVDRDTVIVHDTVPDINPTPKDSATIRYVTRYLPIAKRDTSSRAADHFRDLTKMVEHLADTSKMIAVEIPITSKHYQSKDYDAWVSGYEPSLDSIKVYQRTEYITETIEKTIKSKRKPWGIGFHVGYGYDFQSKTAAPFVGVGVSYDIISF
jgi:hypothetical protein